ncbi:MAG: hypothetical protein ABI114_09890 [Rhodanobacter sp.]
MSDSVQRPPVKPKPLTQRKALTIAGVVAILIGACVAAVGALVNLSWMLQLGGVLAFTGMIWMICAALRKPEPMRTVQRQFMRAFFPAMAAYLILLPASIVLLQHFTVPPLWKAVIVLLPVLPMLLVIRAMVRFLRGLDELQQRIQLQALGITCAVVGSATFALGFLQGADLVPASADQLLWVLPAMFGVWGVAVWFISRSFRDE